MSEAPEPPEAEVLAAEHALGVLSARERGEAEARMARDPAFAADVEAWRARLAPLAGAVAAVEPPRGVWPRILAALPTDEVEALRARVRLWRTSAVTGLALAAASLAAVVALIANPPMAQQISPLPRGEVLKASLMSPGSRVQPLFVAAYDPDRKALIITSLLAADSDPRKVHELWVMERGRAPMPLGFIEPGKSKMIDMPRGMHGHMAEGAALVVSIEPPGGSPNPAGPTGPIAAMGRLSKL